MKINLIKNLPLLSKKDLPALVFIHGAWHGAWCWQEYFIPFFTKNGYECYSFDLPNHGEYKDKKNINKYSVKDYTNHLELAIKQINKPVVLIGHSMGGYIIQKYLEKADCKAGILITPVPCKPIWRLFFKLLLMQPLAMLKMIVTLDPYQIVNSTEKATSLLFSEAMPYHKRVQFTKKLGRESFKVIVFDFLLSKIKRRKNLAIPLLVQCAGKDQIVSLEETKYTRRFQQADYQFFKEMAHDIMLDPKWKLSANAILSWLNNKFPTEGQPDHHLTKNFALKTQFPNAIQDLIANLGENNEIDADDIKTLRQGKSKRDN